MKKNEVHLRFTIFGFDITHNEISESLGILPSSIRVKGQKKNPRNPDSPLIDVNTWTMDSGLDMYSNFDDQIKALFDILEPKLELLRPFCEKYYCEFSCGIFVYFDNGESTPWVHLDSRYNKLIKQLNIEFDVDLYVLPNDNTALRD